MTAGIHNFVCEQGATFHRELTLTDEAGAVNLTGYTARMQVRRDPGNEATLLDLTTENGGLALDSGGGISIDVTAAATGALTRGGVYDLEIEAPDGTVTRLLKGDFYLDNEISR